MKVVITGGSGLIGRALAFNLAADKHQVIVLSRNPQEARKMPSGVQLARWDARTAESWVEHAEDADAIVNLAGATLDNRWTDAYKKRILESRVQAGEAVTAVVKAAKKKPKVVIQASAIGYYGVHGDEILTESASGGSDFLANVCKEWEASTSGVEKQGVRRVIIRSGIVLSTKGGTMARLLPFFRMFVGGPLGSGKQYYSWIHIGDEVDAIRFLIEKEDASGVFNLTAPKPVTNKEFVKALGRALNRPALVPVPSIALKLLLGEMATLAVDGQRVVPQRLQEMGYHFRFSEPEAAFRHLLYSGVDRLPAL